MPFAGSSSSFIALSAIAKYHAYVLSQALRQMLRQNEAHTSLVTEREREAPEQALTVTQYFNSAPSTTRSLV
jgi:hypothetical protein